MHRIMGLVAIGAVVLTWAGCSDDEVTLTSILDAIDDGESCSALFEMRNQLDPNDPSIPRINDAFRAIGCNSASSNRTS